MKWYEIILTIIIIVIGFYISGKVSETRKGYKYNDSWKTRDKKRDFKSLSIKFIL